MKKIIKKFFKILLNILLIIIIVFLTNIIWNRAECLGDFEEIVQEVWMLILIFLLVIIPSNFLTWLFEDCFGVLFYKLGKLNRFVKQTDKSDFILDKEYYREILKENSPLILGYLDNLDIDKNKLIAEILYLERKGLIEFDNGKIVIKYKKLPDGIPEYEKNFLEKIRKGKIKKEVLEGYIHELREYIERRAKNSSLVHQSITRKNKAPKYVLEEIIMYVIHILYLVIIQCIMSHYLNNDYVLECIVYVVYMLIPLVIQILFFWRGKYNLGRGDTFYKRTQRGEELNKKLEGLKHYLEDYSLLSEREAKEIELWEDYLIYSVMFGQNKKVIEEYEKYIEIEEDSRI